MEDHRMALKKGKILHFSNKNGERMNFVIEEELGRGSSCIVYEASRVADTGNKSLYRIKELYPYKLNISRDKGNRLLASLLNAEKFEEEKEKFKRDFSRTSHLFYSDSNYASMTNQMDIFCENGSCYIVSAYSSRKTLKNYVPDSLKECIQLVIQVAFVLGRIHKQGYLYLDIKPENVLVVDGYKKQIQLFDFDSLLSVKKIRQSQNGEVEACRISYTKGFSAFELQSGKIGLLGSYTDVFGVGALLFYLLFGKIPKAPDCEMDADYDFTKLKFDYEKCDDRLFHSLIGFFHKSLAVYYADRYQSMDELLESLKKMEGYADLTEPRIYSTSYHQIAAPKNFCGREGELACLEKMLKDSEQNCIFITGMGGIGKSSLIRYYLCSHKESFDIMLFVDYKGSIEETIADDRNIEINTLRQEESGRSTREYFEKKLRKLKELIREKRAILVIDNFTGESEESLDDLIQTGIKLILVSRKSAAYQAYGELRLGAITDEMALQHIFERNLGRAVKEEEREGFEKILCETQGHTLSLELIAKQIASSHITISKAAELSSDLGFTAIAPEKIFFEKDRIRKRKTIGDIIDALFEADGLSADKKSLMKTLSLTGDRGIDINELQRRLRLKSKDDVNELIYDGWVVLKGDTVTLHHVIWEAVHRWTWEKQYLKVVEAFFNSFYREIRNEAEKNNYPLKLRKEDVDYSRPADIEKLHDLILQAEDILEQGKKEEAVRKNAAYIRLSYVTLLHAPVYQEEYILQGAQKLLKENTGIKKIETEEADQERMEEWHMKLYASAALICADRDEFDKALELINGAWHFAKKMHRSKIYALYYDLLGNYYDIRLSGAYDSGNKEEKALFQKMVNADEKVLHYSKNEIDSDIDHLYIKNLIAKAVLMIRSGRASDKKIKDLLMKAEKIIWENTGRFADVRLHWFLAAARYFSIIRRDIDGAKKCLEAAWGLSDDITATDMQKIENLIIPSANIFYELNESKTSLKILEYGIGLCEKYPNSDAYSRIKEDLQSYRREVEYYSL